MQDIKLGSKQIRNLHILFENISKYDKRFHGYKLLPISYNKDSYEDFEKNVIDFLKKQAHDSDDYSNALSYFGIYPDEYDQNFVVAKKMIDLYGNYLDGKNIIEVATGNFPALSLKIAQLYPEVNNIIVYDHELVVNKKDDIRDVSELERIDIRKEEFDSSKEIPKNSIIISRHPCTSLPGIIASRTINKDNNVDLYTVLCNCTNELINIDVYDLDDRLIRPGVYSTSTTQKLDRYIAATLFAEDLRDSNGYPISWQDNLEEYFSDDLDYNFDTTEDPITQSRYRIMYTKKR